MYKIKDNRFESGEPYSGESLEELIRKVITDDMIAERLNEVAWIKNRPTYIFLPFIGDSRIGELTVVYAKYKGTYAELFDEVIADIVLEIEDTFKHSTEVSMYYEKFTITKDD